MMLRPPTKDMQTGISENKRNERATVRIELGANEQVGLCDIQLKHQKEL